jgi:DNA-binding transcriptional ArsR family regulator
MNAVDSEHQTGSAPGTREVKTVDNVEALRALADPIRLAILSVLMDQRGELPVMSVKELAARIGEPQTKLYRHVKVLEAAGLIKVAASRLVSGILEQRYQASQRDVMFDGRFLRSHMDDSEAAVGALLDSFRAGFFAAFADKRLDPDGMPEAERYRLPTVYASEVRVSPARAAEIRRLLRDLMTLLSDGASEETGEVVVNVFMGYYAETESAPDRAQS